MKSLRHLKEEKKKIGMLEPIQSKLREIHRESKSLRQESDEVHKLIKSKAEESQLLHLQFTEISKQVDGIDKKKEQW